MPCYAMPCHVRCAVHDALCILHAAAASPDAKQSHGLCLLWRLPDDAGGETGRLADAGFGLVGDDDDDDEYDDDDDSNKVGGNTKRKHWTGKMGKGSRLWWWGHFGGRAVVVELP